MNSDDKIICIITLVWSVCGVVFLEGNQFDFEKTLSNLSSGSAQRER